MSIAASSRVERLAAAMAPIQRMVDSPIWGRRGAPGMADFMVGNPLFADEHPDWPRANGKWIRYEPLEWTGNLQRFLIEVEKDPHHCFKG